MPLLGHIELQLAHCCAAVSSLQRWWLHAQASDQMETEGKVLAGCMPMAVYDMMEGLERGAYVSSANSDQARGPAWDSLIKSFMWPMSRL